mmetsp:Transcript_42020/g.106853  ORF Transcript_42020/g.106853 Transcript_42020/m.106853 type:complete len:94 (-) Transcript_42020:327-608(-)
MLEHRSSVQGGVMSYKPRGRQVGFVQSRRDDEDGNANTTKTEEEDSTEEEYTELYQSIFEDVRKVSRCMCVCAFGQLAAHAHEEVCLCDVVWH